MDAAFAAYSRDRIELEHLLAKYTKFKGSKAHTSITDDEDVAVANFKSKQLDILGIAEHSRQDAAEGIQISADMDAAFKRYFGPKANFSLSVIEPENTKAA
ncbi:hypothetical protein [Devosia submarina]|uniref:hypothetical protein n=1 Tax=Devosia submarina TaxID=1173082 RepID=UPI000D3C5F70|nr:hypothetical protein [Devosia submarina]